MNIRNAGWVTLIVGGLWLGAVGSGCSRNTAPVNQMEIALKLPGATNAFAALAKKDYDGAMTAWAKVKESVSTPEQQTEFSAFTREFKNRLMEASNTDPKAAEALGALRAMTSGR